MSDQGARQVVFWCMRHTMMDPRCSGGIPHLGQMLIEASVDQHMTGVSLDNVLVAGQPRTHMTAIEVLHAMRQPRVAIQEAPTLGCDWIERIDLNCPSVLETLHRLAEEQDNEPTIGDLRLCNKRVPAMHQRFLWQLHRAALDTVLQPNFEPSDKYHVLIVSSQTVIEAGLPDDQYLAGFTDMARYEFKVDPDSCQVNRIEQSSTFLPCPMSKRGEQ